MKSQKGHRYSNLNSRTKSASRTNTHTTRNFRYRNVLPGEHNTDGEKRVLLKQCRDERKKQRGVCRQCHVKFLLYVKASRAQ